MQMLDEVLREDKSDLLERKACSNIENLIDAGIRNVVDVDPALEAMRSASDVKALHGRL